MTLENFRATVLFRSQRSISDTVELDRLINAGYLDVAITDIPFPELDDVQSETMVVSQIAYDLPSDWYFYRKSGARITGPDDADRKRLLPMTRTVYMGKTDYDTDAQPSHYLQDAGGLLVYPSADKAYTCEFDYRKKPAVLTTGLSTVIGIEWDEAVVLAGIAHVYQALQEHEKFLVANNDFIQYVRRRTPQEELEKFPSQPLGVAWDEADLS